MKRSYQARSRIDIWTPKTPIVLRSAQLKLFKNSQTEPPELLVQTNSSNSWTGSEPFMKSLNQFKLLVHWTGLTNSSWFGAKPLGTLFPSTSAQILSLISSGSRKKGTHDAFRSILLSLAPVKAVNDKLKLLYTLLGWLHPRVRIRSLVP